MGYQRWCEAVRSAILATAWLLVFIFLLFLLCDYAVGVNWCDLAVLPPVSVIGQFIKQSWSHSHSVNYIHDSFYRAMHFSAKRGIAIACRLSVCLSVCNVGEL